MDNAFKNNIETIAASKKTKIKLSIISIFLISLSIVIILMPIYDGKQRGILSTLLLLSMGLGSFFYFIYLIISVYQNKIEFHSDKVVQIGLFKEKTISYSEVLGYRIVDINGNKSVKIFSRDNKSIDIDHINFDSKKEVLKWLCSSFKNLDELDLEKELNEIVANEEYGIDKEERTQRLKQAKIVSRILNIFSVVAGFWTILRPQPYRWAIWIMLILPFITYTIIRYYKGLIRHDTTGEKLHPNVAIAYITPSSALAMRALMDWNILEWKNFWIPFIFISLLLFAYAYLSASEIRNKIWPMLGIMFFCLMYGYGSTVSLNGIYSNSNRTNYSTEILDKKIDKGRPTTYHFNLSSWELKKKIKEERVYKNVFDKYKVGDKVKIIVRSGLFKIIWYDIE